MKYASAFIVLISLLAPQLSVAQTSATLDRIKQTGTMRIGFRENEPPMSFRDKDNKPIGYSIDLCTRIANEVKSTLNTPDMAVEFVPVTAANRFDMISDQKIDILCGSTTKTLSRSERVDFTQLTFVTGASLLSLDSSTINGITDLQGKKVAVVKGTTTIDYLNKALKAAVSDAVVVPVDTAAEGMKALTAGDVDAFASDQVVLIGLLLTQDSPEKFAVASQLFSFEPFALAVARNDSDFRLIADRVLSRLNRNGQIGPIYGKWFSKFAKQVPNLLKAMYYLNSTPK